MAGDPFSSHPYPARKQIMPYMFYCHTCDRDMRYIDKGAHERGKKHGKLVAENNKPLASQAGSNGDWLGITGGASGKACHNCGQADHMSRDCTKPRKDTRECHSCGEVGHAKADCPNKPRQTCHNCGEEGHRKSDCTNERLVTCNNCKNTGHFAKECPEEPNPANFKCNNCENMGHKARDCPEPKDWSKVRCNTCQQMGHTSKRCTAEPVAVDGGWGSDNTADVLQPTTNGSWDDTAVAPEAPPTKSWDDTQVPGDDAPTVDGWGSGDSFGAQPAVDVGYVEADHAAW